MKKSCDCGYSPLCSKMDKLEHMPVSYWPRDPDLKPYCKGEEIREETPEKCAIHNHWEGNPTVRESIENIRNPDNSIAYGYSMIALGQTLVWSPIKSIPAAVLSSLVGACMLANGLSRHYKGKNFLKWLKTRNDRKATEEIYQRILERADGCDEANPDEILDSLETADILINTISMVDGPVASISGAKSAAWKDTNFRVGKLHVSYPLTQNFEVSCEMDVGIVLSYEYQQKGCSNPECPNMNTHYYITGVLDPVIHKKKIKKNTKAFIEGTVNQDMPPLPIPISSDEGIMIGLATSTLTGAASIINTVGNVFGSQRRIEEIAESAKMNNKTTTDTRNVHKLMQEVLYSDF